MVKTVEERKGTCIESITSKKAASLPVVSAGEHSYFQRRCNTTPFALKARIFSHVHHLVDTLTYRTISASASSAAPRRQPCTGVSRSVVLSESDLRTVELSVKILVRDLAGPD